MRFAQVTDLHIVPRGETLHGLEPVHRLERCVAEINRHRARLDMCLFTGDLAERGDQASYAVLREILGSLQLPYRLVLGNHDRRRAFTQVFPETPTDADGFVQHELDTDVGRFLFLDTLEEGQSPGVYCSRRRDWLAARLQAAGSRPVYLFMHHPPFNIGLPSLDRIKLEDPDRFAAVLQAHGNIRHLFFGHVHRPLSGSWRGIPFSALPSTNHQVATDYETVQPVPFCHQPPAYAHVELENDFTLVHLHAFE